MPSPRPRRHSQAPHSFMCTSVKGSSRLSQVWETCLTILVRRQLQPMAARSPQCRSPQGIPEWCLGATSGRQSERAPSPPSRPGVHRPPHLQDA